VDFPELEAPLRKMICPFAMSQSAILVEPANAAVVPPKDDSN
jgi:hypothetical protein